MSVLTKTFDFRADAIITDCFVVMPEGVKDKDGNRKYCHIENAAWDTGATNTIIVEVNTYTIDLCFQNGYRIANLQVMSDEENNDFDYDVLIGVDVITEGDFCVSTKEDKTQFFFRMPAEGFQV